MQFITLVRPQKYKRFFVTLVGMVSLFSVACGEPPSASPHSHHGDDYLEHVYNQARILETWEKVGAFYVSP